MHTALVVRLQGLTSWYPSKHWLQGWHFAHLPSLYVLFLQGVLDTSCRPPSSSYPQLGVTSRPGVRSPNITHLHIASHENITYQYIPSFNVHGTHVELLLSQRVVRLRHLSEYPILTTTLVRTEVPTLLAVDVGHSTSPFTQPFFVPVKMWRCHQKNTCHTWFVILGSLKDIITHPLCYDV